MLIFGYNAVWWNSKNAVWWNSKRQNEQLSNFKSLVQIWISLPVYLYFSTHHNLGLVFDLVEINACESLSHLFLPNLILGKQKILQPTSLSSLERDGERLGSLFRSTVYIVGVWDSSLVIVPIGAVDGKFGI